MEVSPNAKPPVCKILDHGKLKYEEKKKQQINKKKQHVIKLKEIRLRPRIEEHDLIIEAIEEIDPQNRVFGKVSEDEDSFYMGDSPEAPELNLGKRKNLDQLMKSKGNEFTGSYGRDEFQEFRNKMTQDFLDESDKAVRDGDHSANIGTVNRVFADVDEEVQQLKRSISEETGMEDPNAEDDLPDGYSIDEDGTEWFEDEDGYWWYRLVGEDEWLPHDE